MTNHQLAQRDAADVVEIGRIRREEAVSLCGLAGTLAVGVVVLAVVYGAAWLARR